MQLNKLSIKDKAIFSDFLDLHEHGLSVYAFQNIFLWKELFDIRWRIIENHLNVFFTDRIGTFLYFEPLAGELKPEAISKAFSILDKLNKNKEFSRIENAEERNLDFYAANGYTFRKKSCDYVCSRSSLVCLRGDRFKSKRASYNHFVKNYKYYSHDFALKDTKDCLGLYDLWASQRRGTERDDVFCFMLEDSRKALGVLLKNYRDLNCAGKLVEVNGKLKGFTFGFRLNTDTFCVLYEITDLSIKGISQFIFREFCREANDFKYINTMDDSGLENLKRVKLSYQPVKLVPTYVVQRKNNHA